MESDSTAPAGERGRARRALFDDELRCRPLLLNDGEKTANFAETVVLVEQVDGLICPDSYLMHPAEMLGIPTVTVFSTIPPHLRVRAYPRVA